MKVYLLYIIIPIVFVLLTHSCESNHDDNYSVASVNVNLLGKDTVAFEKLQKVGNTSIISFKKKTYFTKNKTLIKNNIRPLPKGITYHVLVYDKSTEEFITLVDFKHGKESKKNILLDAGKKYVFIAYSLGTTNSGSAQLPPVPNNNGRISTLSKAQLVIDPNYDIMYFYKDDLGALSKEQNNNLEIVLKSGIY